MPIGIYWTLGQKGDPSREQQSHSTEETKVGVWGGQGGWNLWGRDLSRSDPGRKETWKPAHDLCSSVDGHYLHEGGWAGPGQWEDAEGKI